MTDKARFAYEGLDRTIHERARLSVLTSLVGHPKGLIFNDLKDLCGLTDGNLSRHLQVLQEAGLVEIIKGYDKAGSSVKCAIWHEFLSFPKALPGWKWSGNLPCIDSGPFWSTFPARIFCPFRRCN